MGSLESWSQMTANSLTKTPLGIFLTIRNQKPLLLHANPQANGQVKVTNWSLLKIIKTWLEGAKGVWPEELLSVL